MKVLMFGWEFPPFNAGGLGTACHGLTKGLKSNNIEVTFILPKAIGDCDTDSTHVKLIVTDNISLGEGELKIRKVNSLLGEYVDVTSYEDRLSRYRYLINKKKSGSGSVYGKNLFEEVHRYSETARLIAEMEDHDIIHAHDWMTYKAAINAKSVSGKPLVVHIHATEFDRTCGHPNQHIYGLEREGFHAADKIIAVSNFTKKKVVEHYGVPADKVHVVHNGVEFASNEPIEKFAKPGKTVLYLGRLTMQKGPEYFLHSAKKTLEVDPDVRFIVAGGGDMEHYLVHMAAEMGIAKNVLFTGFLRGQAIDQAYRMADLYIMPSVSEPFGITPLEAMRNNTPCIISKTSGVSEVLNHCLKVDFWDVNMMSNMILSTLKYKPLHQMLKENGKSEVHRCNWEDSARKCIEVYKLLA